jgi:catechol 2,3-dioxygenase-like lactoylglutathione lyase family enzyme
VTPKLDFFGIVVSDMARSLAFYRKLGLDFPDGAEGEDHVEAELTGGFRYALDMEDVIRSFDPEWQRPTGGHAEAGTFRCDSPAEVDQLYAELIEGGGRTYKEPWDAFWGMRYAQLEDPDGNLVSLYARLGSDPGV